MKISQKIFTSLLLLLFIPGCISNLFKEPKPTFSTDILLPALPIDYQKLDDNVYPAWKHKDTGNVISVISDCNAGHFTLKSIHSLMSDSLDSFKIAEEKNISIANHKSYYKKINGQIEDKIVEIQSYSLADKKCLFVVSLAGKPEKLSQNQVDFKNFIQKIEFKK
ncbi:MAG: hypothetical protein ACK4VO_05495 [Pseudobdellovibrio sp.]